MTYDVSSKDLETLKPVYTHVLKDIRENGKQSIFLEKILNSHQEENVDEAILLVSSNYIYLLLHNKSLHIYFLIEIARISNILEVVLL